MKKSSQIIGLPLLSVKEGRECGIVRDMIIDAVKKTTRLLSLDTGSGCFGIKALPLEKVGGMGDEMLTTSHSSGLVPFWQEEEAMALAYCGSDLIGSKVAASDGTIVGEVAEYAFDEQSGTLLSIELKDGAEIRAEAILTLGQGIVFVVKGVSDAKVAKPQEAADVKAGTTSREELEQIFNKRKNEYLISKLKEKEKEQGGSDASQTAKEVKAAK